MVLHSKEDYNYITPKGNNRTSVPNPTLHSEFLKKRYTFSRSLFQMRTDIRLH